MKLACSGWDRLPSGVRAALLMVTGCLLFSIMGALVKLLGQRLDSFQIAFFRCFFGFLATLPFVLPKKSHKAFRTTHFYGHFLRGALGVAGMVAGFYATTHLPLTDSTAISFTAPLFMILTAIFLLGETVRWRRGLATLAGFIGVLVMVRPDSGTLDLAAAVGLFAAFLAALSTTLIKRLSSTEEASPTAAARSKVPPSGRTMTSTPINPARVASPRRHRTVSPRRKIAVSIIKSGAVKLIAVESVSGRRVVA
jgi:drug/metabolite transporter (DMT)-like permease